MITASPSPPRWRKFTAKNRNCIVGRADDILCPRNYLLAAFYAVQALAVTAWWLLLLSLPDLIEYFKPRDFGREFFVGFCIPDAAIVGCSLFTSAAILRREKNLPAFSCATAVLTVYPTIYCIVLSNQTGEAWLAAGLMSTMLFSNYIACSLLSTQEDSKSIKVFRVVERSLWNARLATAAQVCVFWLYFLYVLPNTLSSLEQDFDLPRFALPVAMPTLFLLLASALGIWSGMTMADAGRGTPLPTHSAPQLVVSGPYRFVRNPMAVAGLFQGVSVGLLLGSPTVILLSIFCCIAWHFLVRPAEERDLQERFGNSYTEYRKSVPLWIPKPSTD